MNHRPLWQCSGLLAAVCLVLTAVCRQAGTMDDKERNNRIVAKAYEMVDQGDFASAVALFNKALDTYPQMARPHLDLALLLHDRQKDYLRAVYHYQRYLELRPDSDKKSLIRERIQQAERMFVSQRVIVNEADGRSSFDLLEENKTLLIKLDALKSTVAELETEVAALRETERQRRMADAIGSDSAGNLPAPSGPAPAFVEAVRPNPPEPSYPPRAVDVAPLTSSGPRPAVIASVSRPSTTTVETTVVALPVTSHTASVSHASPAPRLPASPVLQNSTPDLRRSYTVQSGDSLSKIAYKVYGDATLWRAIQTANHEMLGSSVDVRVGQVIVIP